MVARVVGDLAALVDDPPRRVDRRERLVRDDDGRPHHPADDRRRPSRGRETDRASTTPSRCRPSRSRSGCSPARSRQGGPHWEAAGRDVRRRRAAVREPQAVAAQRVPLAHGLRRVAPRARDRGRGDRRPRRPRRGSRSGGTTPRRTSTCPPTTSPPTARPCSTATRNPRIRHLLAQIAADGSQKVPIRAVPVIRAELDEGRVAAGATRIVAAWVAHLRGHGAPVTDAAADESSRSPRANRASRCGPCSPTSASSPRPWRRPWRTSSRTSSPGPGHDRGAGRHRARRRDDRGQGRRLRGPRVAPGRLGGAGGAGQWPAVERRARVPPHPTPVRLARPGSRRRSSRPP